MIGLGPVFGEFRGFWNREVAMPNVLTEETIFEVENIVAKNRQINISKVTAVI